jgi:hypothetical protein
VLADEDGPMSLFRADTDQGVELVEADGPTPGAHHYPDDGDASGPEQRADGGTGRQEEDGVDDRRADGDGRRGADRREDVAGARPDHTNREP